MALVVVDRDRGREERESVTTVLWATGEGGSERKAVGRSKN